MKTKKKNKRQRNKKRQYNIVVPYATETTTQTYKTMEWK